MTMWGRRDAEDGSNEPKPEVRPASRPPYQSSQQAAPPVRPPSSAPKAAAVSRIGKSVKFKGEIHAGEDLQIEGAVEGKILIPDCQLTVGPNSVVQAEVLARSIVLQGRLVGKVSVTDRAEIQKRGHFEGDLVTNRLVIEDGAVFRGTSEMRPTETEGAAKGKPAKPGAGRPPKPDGRTPLAAAPVRPLKGGRALTKE